MGYDTPVTRSLDGYVRDSSPFFVDLREKMSKYFIYSCTGGRGIGKTYSFAKLAIDEFVNKGKTSAYVRRRPIEIEGSETMFVKPFKDWQEDCGDSKDIVFKKGIYYYDNEPFLWFIPLNTAKRGMTIPDCNKVMYDEYIPKDGIYLKNEFKRFFDLYESLIRLRSGVDLEDDGRIILCANNDGKYNLYTNELKVIYNNDKYVKDDLMYFEIMKSSDSFVNARKKSRVGQVLANSETFSYMYENKNVNYRPDLIYKGKPIQDLRLVFCLNLAGYILGVYENNKILFIRYNPKEVKNTRTNNSLSFWNDPYVQYMKYMYNNDSLRFENTLSMEIFCDNLHGGIKDEF